jgi:hypothetical protein
MNCRSLLTAVAGDVFFKCSLAGVTLSRCVVRVCASASPSGPSVDEEKAGMELQAFDTVGDLAARMPAADSGGGRYLYARVRLTPPRAGAEAGGGDAAAAGGEASVIARGICACRGTGALHTSMPPAPRTI